MQPNLIVHNANSADIMTCGPACLVNPNDIMCGPHNMHVPVSEASLHNNDMSHYIYWPGMHACQPSTTNNTHFTFLGNNYPNANTNMPMKVLIA